MCLKDYQALEIIEGLQLLLQTKGSIEMRSKWSEAIRARAQEFKPGLQRPLSGTGNPSDQADDDWHDPFIV